MHPEKGKKTSRKRRRKNEGFLVNFWSDFGMLLATFWGPKALHFLMRFFKSFLGAETDRRVSDGTSTGLRRDFDAGVSPTDPPLAAPSSRTEESNNDRKERKTRDPTRPGSEARRIVREGCIYD